MAGRSGRRKEGRGEEEEALLLLSLSLSLLLRLRGGREREKKKKTTTTLEETFSSLFHAFEVISSCSPFSRRRELVVLRAAEHRFVAIREWKEREQKEEEEKKQRRANCFNRPHVRN